MGLLDLRRGTPCCENGPSSFSPLPALLPARGCVSCFIQVHAVDEGCSLSFEVHGIAEPRVNHSEGSRACGHFGPSFEPCLTNGDRPSQNVGGPPALRRDKLRLWGVLVSCRILAFRMSADLGNPAAGSPSFSLSRSLSSLFLSSLL